LPFDALRARTCKNSGATRVSATVGTTAVASFTELLDHEPSLR
jgi:hypothetical protein